MDSWEENVDMITQICMIICIIIWLQFRHIFGHLGPPSVAMYQTHCTLFRVPSGPTLPTFPTFSKCCPHFKQIPTFPTFLGKPSLEDGYGSILTKKCVI